MATSLICSYCGKFHVVDGNVIDGDRALPVCDCWQRAFAKMREEMKIKELIMTNAKQYYSEFRTIDELRRISRRLERHPNAIVRFLELLPLEERISCLERKDDNDKE